MPFRQQFESSGLGPYQHMMQSYFGGLDNTAQGYEPVMKGMARIQLEMMSFASRRAQAYLEIPSRMATCRTPQDLMNEQMRFWQTAFQQYSDGSRRVMTAMASMSQPPTAADNKSKARGRDYLSVPDAQEQTEPRDTAPRPSPPRRVA